MLTCMPISNDGSVVEVSLLMGQVHDTMCKEEDRVSNNHWVHLGASWGHITVVAYCILSVAPCEMAWAPYKGKFSCGAKFCIFRIKLQDAKI